MTNILLCTLGGSWAVIPEVYGFLAPNILPMYRHHPEAGRLERLRREYALQPPDEIWVCTTGGTKIGESLDKLQHWRRLLPAAPELRIWRAAGTDELASQAECAAMRELIVRACLKAHEVARSGQVLLSLAGGRKTMSADMQWAGSLFGCQALLHVIGADKLPDVLSRNAQPETFARPLPEDLGKYIMPLIAGQTTRSDLLDIRVDAAGPVRSEDYPVSLPESGKSLAFTDSNHSLSKELEKREKASSSLFGNFLLEISNTERHENWRSLYRLPPRIIERLRLTTLQPKHRDWLQQLPKADLHRHLGGCLDLPAQRRVGQAIWDDLSPADQNAALRNCQSLLDKQAWEWDWPELLKKQGERAHNSAALLVHASDRQLWEHLWQNTSPRVALKIRDQHGFTAYERPGELTGSAVLSHPAAIGPYASEIVRQAQDEGLAYVELRGSPQKYGNAVQFLQRFRQSVDAALTSLPKDSRPLFRFIIIVDRRADREKLASTLELAAQAKRELPGFVVGVDMAGDEQCTKPADIADLFIPVFEECMPLTIHAGEGESADCIWQAAYHLHADRIGHGLSIDNNEKLARRFRDRNICLELCPSSNREVVGFRDPDYPETVDCADYPGMSLWRKGMPLTLCTDNPGISRTTLADEYLTLARMSDYGLYAWDALAMIKQGFVHSFPGSDDRERLIKEIDVRIYRLIADAPDWQ